MNLVIASDAAFLMSGYDIFICILFIYLYKESDAINRFGQILCQTFADSSFLNVRICCLSLSVTTVNETFRFSLLVGQREGI